MTPKLTLQPAAQAAQGIASGMLATPGTPDIASLEPSVAGAEQVAQPTADPVTQTFVDITRPAAAKPLITASRYVTNARGDKVRLVAGGLEMNGVTTSFWTISQDAMRYTIKIGAIPGDPRALHNAMVTCAELSKRAVEKPQDYKRYEQFLKLCILIPAGPAHIIKAISNKGDKLEEAATLVDRSFAELFPEHPPLPVSMGVYTDAAEARKIYDENKSTRLIIYAIRNADNNLLGFGRITDDWGFKIGPVKFTFEELRTAFCENLLFSNTADYQRQTGVRLPTKLLHDSTSGLRNWLNDETVPIEARGKVLLMLLLDVASDKPGFLIGAFSTGHFTGITPAEAVKRVNKFTSDFFTKRAKKQVDAGPSVVRPESWQLLPLRAATTIHRFEKQPIPDKSYTIFKRVDEIRSLMSAVVRDMNENSRTSAWGTTTTDAEGNRDLKLLRRAFQTGDPIVDAIFLDFMIQLLTHDHTGVLDFSKVALEEDLKLRKKQAIELYKSYFPYGAALLAQLDKEAHAGESPEKTAHQLAMELTNPGLRFFGPWQKLVTKRKKDIAQQLISALEKAMVFAGNDREIYMPWVQAVAALPDDKTKWRWLFKYKPAEDPDGRVIAQLFQDVAYPMGVAPAYFKAPPSPTSGHLGFNLGGDAWQAFAGSIGYLFPMERDAVVSQLIDATRYAKGAVADFRRRHPREALTEDLQKMQSLCNPQGFAEALTGLAGILSGKIGRENAMTVRELLRLAIAKHESYFVTLLKVGRLANKDEASATYALDLYRKIETFGQQISGDFLATPLAIASAQTGSGEERGAFAEYATITNYLSRGYAIESVAVDAYHKSSTPDIMARKDGEKILIEIKSRGWSLRDRRGNNGEPLKTLARAESQLNQAARGLDATQKRIVVYLTVDEDITGNDMESIGQTIRTARMSGISGVDIYFAETSAAGWSVFGAAVFDAPDFSQKINDTFPADLMLRRPS